MFTLGDIHLQGPRVFAGVFKKLDDGMAIVKTKYNPPRVRVALFICPRPLECRSRLFARLPLAPPKPSSPSQEQEAGMTDKYLRMVLYFSRE
jgi:hypothetical protein